MWHDDWRWLYCFWPLKWYLQHFHRDSKSLLGRIPLSAVVLDPCPLSRGNPEGKPLLWAWPPHWWSHRCSSDLANMADTPLIPHPKEKEQDREPERRWLNEMVYLRKHALDYNELSDLQNNFLFHRLLGWLWPDEDRSSRQDTQNNLLLSVPLLSDEMLPWTHRKSQIQWSLTQIYFSQWDCYSRWTGSGFGCTLFTVIAFWTNLTVLFSTITYLCAIGAWRAWVLWAI